MQQGWGIIVCLHVKSQKHKEATLALFHFRPNSLLFGRQLPHSVSLLLSFACPNSNFLKRNNNDSNYLFFGLDFLLVSPCKMLFFWVSFLWWRFVLSLWSRRLFDLLFYVFGWIIKMWKKNYCYFLEVNSCNSASSSCFLHKLQGRIQKSQLPTLFGNN